VYGGLRAARTALADVKARMGKGERTVDRQMARALQAA